MNGCRILVTSLSVYGVSYCFSVVNAKFIKQVFVFAAGFLSCSA